MHKTELEGYPEIFIFEYMQLFLSQSGGQAGLLKSHRRGVFATSQNKRCEFGVLYKTELGGDLEAFTFGFV